MVFIFWVIIASIYLILAVFHFIWSMDRYSRLEVRGRGIAAKVSGVSTGIVEAADYISNHIKKANIVQAIGFLIACGAASFASFLSFQ
jgi:hypothetical protein